MTDTWGFLFVCIGLFCVYLEGLFDTHRYITLIGYMRNTAKYLKIHLGEYLTLDLGEIATKPVVHQPLQAECECQRFASTSEQSVPPADAAIAGRKHDISSLRLSGPIGRDRSPAEQHTPKRLSIQSELLRKYNVT